MQAKVKAACAQCHDAGRITEQHMTRDEWAKELEKMEGLGAVIPDEDRERILIIWRRILGRKKGTAKPRLTRLRPLQISV